MRNDYREYVGVETRQTGISAMEVSVVDKGGLRPDEVAPIVENPNGYPSPWGAFRSALPAYGIFIRRADDVKLEKVVLRTANLREARPPKVVENAVVTCCD